MTLFSLRTTAALLLAASLASCGGGGSTSYPIGGTVSGLGYGPLVLTAAGQTVNVQPNTANTADTLNPVTFTFAKALGYGDPYLVALSANPPHQSCLVNQAVADSAGHTATINILVSCTTNSYTISGYVHGLVGDGLQLVNGSLSGTIPLTAAGVAANATTEAAAAAAAAATVPPTTTYTLTPSFTFPALFYGQTYGVTVLTQPAGQTCTVKNGTGTVGDAAVVNISVDCVNN